MIRSASSQPAPARRSRGGEFVIPPLPSTVGEIVQLISEKPQDADERLIQVVERDPATTAYVLRRLNSSYYGMRREVTAINRAVVLLGFREVCNLALSAGLKQTAATMGTPEAKAIFEHVMRISVASAAFARALAAEVLFPLPESTYTVGLLHQFGRVVLLNNVAKPYTPLWFEEGHDYPVAPSRDTERSHFNTDYTILGAALAKKWKLPSDFVDAIHHQLEPGTQETPLLRALTALVAAGSAAAQRLYEPHHPESLLVDALLQLSRFRKTDVDRLVGVIEEREGVVREYADMALSA